MSGKVTVIFPGFQGFPGAVNPASSTTTIMLLIRKTKTRVTSIFIERLTRNYSNPHHDQVGVQNTLGSD